MKRETEYVKIELINGIIEAAYKPIYINVEAAQSVLETRGEFTVSQSYPMLLDGVGLLGINKDARDLFSEPIGTLGLTATAIVVKSRLDTFLANFFIKVNVHKSPIPLKLFTDKKEALDWLEQYKIKP